MAVPSTGISRWSVTDCWPCTSIAGLNEPILPKTDPDAAEPDDDGERGQDLLGSARGVLGRERQLVGSRADADGVEQGILAGPTHLDGFADGTDRIRIQRHRRTIENGAHPYPVRVISTAGPDVDVLVVGAGPAGVAAAIELRRAGRDVVVIDKATFPRDKCCGDGLTTLALRELEHLGFEPATVPSFTTVDAVVLRSPSGRSVELPLPERQGLYAAVTPRVELDAALVDLAAAAGVKVHQGHGVTNVADHGTNVTVDVDGIGPITAGHVVAADGMWSPTRKLLGLHEEGYLGEWHAIRQYVSGVTGPARDRLIVWFDADFLPGYAWSFPLPDGRANVGFGILRQDGRPTKEMKAVWADVLRSPARRRRTRPRPRPRSIDTWRGRSRPGSTRPASPTAECCSSATPLRPPT